MLRRLGNKQRLMEKIFPFFAPHKMRIELFLGAGGAFFDLPKPKYAVLNDLDNDVFNLYHVVKNHPDELVQELKMMPISSTLLQHWRTNPETEPIAKAVRFLLLSNFTYMGKGDTLKVGVSNSKKILVEAIANIFTQLQHAIILNEDFREVLSKIDFSETICSRKEAFVYLDPIYLDTEHNYKVPKWTEADTLDCLQLLANEGVPGAMSEFDHPFVIENAEQLGLHIIPICERRTLGNRRTEILILNYKPLNTLF